MLAMKWCSAGVVMIAGIVSGCTMAQHAPKTAIQATVCEIVNNPQEFRGKLVQVRAQFFDQQGQFWINEASLQFDKVCHFLAARFRPDTFPGGSRGFGTFIGVVVNDPPPLNSPLRGKDGRLVFLVEKVSDIYRPQDNNGPLPVLQLYDNQSGSFVRPQ
jgi:hypothetical protein